MIGFKDDIGLLTLDNYIGFLVEIISTIRIIRKGSG